MKGPFLLLHLFWLVILTQTPGVYALSVPPTPESKKWLRQELRLSPEQRSNIKLILKKHDSKLIESLKAANEAQENLRVSFRTSSKGEEFNQQLLKKFDLYRDLRTHYRRTRFLMALEIRDNLTAEQLAMFQSLSDKAKKKKEK